MELALITVAQLVAALREALEPLPAVDAMWLGGSAAFGRDDDLSDLDVVLQVDDAAIEAVFTAAEAALTALSPLSARYRIPEPTWHGMRQCFYQLADAPEHRMVDLCVRGREKGSGPNFEVIEIHGTPRVVFDKVGAVQPVHADRVAIDVAIAARLERTRDHYRIFRHLPAKELARAHGVDALHFYQQLLLGTLMRLLRMRYDPLRYDWGSRYLERHLPPEVFAELQPLYFVGDIDDLRAKVADVRQRIDAEFDHWDRLSE